MLSRRSVRIKVMQLLYMLNRDEQLSFPDLLKEYNDGIWKAFEIYVFQLYLLLKVTQQAEKDAEMRAAKLLPSDEDKTFTPRLYNNPLTKSLANHTDFLNIVAKFKANENLDEDLLRRVYQAFAETAEYKAYLELAEPTDIAFWSTTTTTSR